jgi:hypothetical protein
MNRIPSRAEGSAPQARRWGLMCAAIIVGLSHPQGLHGQTQEEDPTRALRSVVRGQVQDYETRRPLEGAAVSLASGPGGTRGIGTRVTNSEGRFLFRSVPAGSYRLVVTLLGYHDLGDTLEVQGGEAMEVILPLSVSPIPLEPLVVEVDRRSIGPAADFERRRRTRIGTFFDREEIEDRDPMFFTDLLRLVPGARLVRAGPYDYSVRLRGGCRPSLWVDGMELMTAEGIDQLLPTMDLEAVEIYHSSSLPVEFGASPCGAIVVWTRRGEPVENPGSLWRRLAVAVGFIVLGLIATR